MVKISTLFPSECVFSEYVLELGIACYTPLIFSKLTLQATAYPARLAVALYLALISEVDRKQQNVPIEFNFVPLVIYFIPPCDKLSIS